MNANAFLRNKLSTIN